MTSARSMKECSILMLHLEGGVGWPSMTFLGYLSFALRQILRRDFCSADVPGTESGSEESPQFPDPRRSRRDRLRQCRSDTARFDPGRTGARPAPGARAPPFLRAISGPVGSARDSEPRARRQAHDRLPAATFFGNTR